MKRTRGARWIVLGTALVATAALGLAGAPVSQGGLPPAPETESFLTAGTFPFVVPADVHTITVEICGAEGGEGGATFVGGGAPDPGGLGGHTTVDITVTPGQMLTIIVGARGGDATPAQGGSSERLGGAGGSGGPNAAGDGGTASTFGGGGGGGGGSAVMSGTTALAVGGGGGGSGGALGGAAT